MVQRASALLALSLLLLTPGFAKTKTKAKNILPPYVLTAHTVAVIIDPDTGVSINDPQANRDAQKNVETALANWGRFLPVLSTQGADLVIVVRKGQRHLVNQTIPNPRQNNRPGVIEPTDNGVMIGGQHGPQSNPQNGPAAGARREIPQSQTEVGSSLDSFLVYDGSVANPLDGVPAWRYMAKNGLRAPEVPAVAEFRKAVLEAEKAKKP